MQNQHDCAYTMPVMKSVLALFFLAALTAACVAQEVTVRVVNVKSGQPLPNQGVVVQFMGTKASSSPLQLTTDAKGDAHFDLPDFQTEHVDVRVVLKTGHWDCGCWVTTDTKTLQQGIVAYAPMKNHDMSVAKANEIIVEARPLRVIERLLWPIMKQ
jgi:hypothetical protein